MRCSACAAAIYCDAACQRTHWKVHKGTCKVEAAARKKQEAAKDAGHASGAFPTARRSGIPLSKEAAMPYLRAAAESRDDPSLHYEYGRLLLESGDESGVPWIRRAALGTLATRPGAFIGIHRGALFMWADCLCRGRGVEKNIEEAVKWFTKAANAGHGESAFVLSELYGDGEEVRQD